MKYASLFKAIGCSSLLLSLQAVQAQTSVTVYGNIDVAVDRTTKAEGNVQGTFFGLNGTTPIPNSVASPKSTTVRLTPSLSSQSFWGLKGTEDLGGGYRANFTVEGGFNTDNGTLTNDGRIFGRQAFVGLLTPGGEFRAGRQASPMLMSYYLTSTERLGTTDLMGAGIVVNTLQTYQDNVLSYIVKKGGVLGALSYSPNAGVPNAVSGARSVATSAAPAATAATGQILGGLTSGTETVDRRGQTFGAMLSYIADDLTLAGSLHRTKMDVPVGIPTAAGSFVPLFNVRNYSGAMAGVKYRIARTDTTLATIVHYGEFDMNGGVDPRVRTIAVGVRQPFGAFSVGLQYFDQRFTNFTRGKDSGLMLGLEYQLSKRTALYSRIGYVKDDRGDTVRGGVTPLPISGGPATVLVPFGSTEIPTFSGAGNNMDARTAIASVGIRHSF